MAFVFGYSNLVVNNGSPSAYLVSMTADWIMVDDGSWNTLRVPMTTPINVDQRVAGPVANGRDQAATFSTTTWINIWAIYNPATLTIAGLFSQVPSPSTLPSFPTLPSGYTHKAWVGAVYNDTNGNFITFLQRDNKVGCSQIQLFSGTASGWTTVDISAMVPVVAKRIWVDMYGTTVNAANYINAYLSPAGSFVGSHGHLDNRAGSYTIVSDIACELTTPQTIWYLNNNGQNNTVSAYLNGWEY